MIGYEIDQPDTTGHRELRLDGGIVCWIKMDDQWDGAEKRVEEFVRMLRESKKAKYRKIGKEE
mgnify:FL=1